MNTQKAAYWFALAIFAVALHSEYQRGAFPSLHNAVNRTGSEFRGLAAHADEAIAMVRVVVGRSAIRPDDLLASADARELAEARAEMLREQTRQRVELLRDEARSRADMVRSQVDMVRSQVDIERSQMDRMRAQMQSEFRFNDAANRRMFVVTRSKCPMQRAQAAVASSDDSVDDADDEF